MLRPNATLAVNDKIGIKTPDEMAAAVQETEELGVAGTIKTAVARLGGVDEIVRWANDSDRNKRELYAMYSKLAQKEQGDTGTNIQINIVNYNGDPDTTLQVPATDISASPV